MLRDKISIIIPIYKVEKFLDKCIQSVVKQTYENIEIILVDDGSPDNCPQLCDYWANKDCRIKVIHKENGGLSDARNVGLAIATGDYIAFVDSDDWILPNMYESMLHVIKQEEADICACNIISCYTDRKVIWGCEEYVVGDSKKILDLLYSDTKYPVSTWNKLYRRECWREVRFPIDKICEDAFTTYKLVHNAKRIVQIPEAFYCYRIRPESIMTSDFSIRRMDEEEAWRINCQFIKENYPQLYNKAFCFYLQKVHMLSQSIPREKRQEFVQQVEFLKRILRDNIMFVIFKRKLGWKYKIKYLIDYIRL